MTNHVTIWQAEKREIPRDACLCNKTYILDAKWLQWICVAPSNQMFFLPFSFMREILCLSFKCSKAPSEFFDIGWGMTNVWLRCDRAFCSQTFSCKIDWDKPLIATHCTINSHTGTYMLVRTCAINSEIHTCIHSYHPPVGSTGSTSLLRNHFPGKRARQFRHSEEEKRLF